MNVAPLFKIHHPQSDHVEDLTEVEHHADGGRPHHEVGEDGLLGGSGYVTVHQVGTGLDVTLDLPGQLEAVVDVVEQVQEGDLSGRLDEEADQVGPPETPVLLAWIVVQTLVRAVLGLVLAFPLLPVGHVQHHHEGRAGDKNQLQCPQANVGDGEVVVVADVSATGLAGVAVEVSLVIAPDPLSSHHEDQDPENEDH